MATLREYFTHDFSDLIVGDERTLTPRDSSIAPVTISARAHYDQTRCVKFLSFYLPPGTEHDWVIDFVIRGGDNVFASVENAVEINMGLGLAGIYAPSAMTDLRTLPFSGRIFVYVESHLGAERAAPFLANAAAAGLHLEFRDLDYAAAKDLVEKPRAFISHDSRDKDTLVRDLAHELSSMLCPVWYDEFSLKIGDSLRDSIDRGLRDCPKCIVILSPAFCDGRGWTAAEFNAAWSRHIASDSGVVLPIWHGISQAEVAHYSPMLADLVALQSSLGVEELARQIVRAITPDRSRPMPPNDGHSPGHS